MISGGGQALFLVEDKDLLQVNATVIAGLLIFLTFSFFGTSSPFIANSTSIAQARPVLEDVSFRLSITLVMLSSFTISAAFIMYNESITEKVEAFKKVARIITFFGFAIIFFTFIVLLLTFSTLSHLK